MQQCRKCQVPNPESNQYCRSCGAVLSVSTTLVKRQRKPFSPTIRKVRWPWVGLGALATLGTLAVLFGVLLVVFLFVFDFQGLTSDPGSPDFSGPFLGYALAGLVVFFLAFGLGGVAGGWISPGRGVLEPVLSAIFVLVILAVAGSVVTVDAILLAAVTAVPCAALAGLGGWIGELLDKGKERR